MTEPDAPAGPTVAKVFDTIAGEYDQSGVAFFRPVAGRLVEHLRPTTGEHALDIGCGRGAATIPLAEAVGDEGTVDAVDISPAMVRATRQLIAEHSLRQVTVEVADAAGLTGLPRTSYDLIASSLVLFFLAEPATVLRGWIDLLRPGGRIGLTTFGELDEPSRAIDALLTPYQPPGLRDPRTTGTAGPFSSDQGMEDLFARAGASDIVTFVEPVTLDFPDAAAWQRFSMSTGQRAMWQNVPADERPGVVSRAGEILAGTGGSGGRLVWQMRYTLGRR